MKQTDKYCLPPNLSPELPGYWETTGQAAGMGAGTAPRRAGPEAACRRRCV